MWCQLLLRNLFRLGCDGFCSGYLLVRILQPPVCFVDENRVPGFPNHSEKNDDGKVDLEDGGMNESQNATVGLRVEFQATRSSRLAEDRARRGLALVSSLSASAMQSIDIDR